MKSNVLIAILVVLFMQNTKAQESNLNELSYTEFLGYVKKYHPLLKSANLLISSSQANLMMARGAFDPKIEIDYDKKQFKDKEYYSILNSSFKIPTWYGIDVKAGFDNAEGVYLNPQNTLPNSGLTSLGLSVPIGQGLLINQRMSDLRKAKIQVQLSKAEQKLQAVQVLYDASVAYFNWRKNYKEMLLYQQYFKNASVRFKGVSSLILNGDKPAIDSVEAGIIMRNRELSLEDSKLKLLKSKLEVATFLWLENDIPLELQDNIIPEKEVQNTIQSTLNIENLKNQQQPAIENHPKILSWQRKLDILEVERQLKSNALLPKIDLGYYYLSERDAINDTNFNNYKVALNFAFPLFLRKERGALQITKFKLQDYQYNLNLERFQLTNKISAQQTELTSLEKQRIIIQNLVQDNTTMLEAEERLFSFGESSIFLINSRENNLVSAQLSQLSLENRYLISNAELFKIMANPD